MTAEFKQSKSHLYQQLEAAQTERNISAIAENAEPIPESHLRPLTKLKDNPAQQRDAWQQAVETAPAGKVTAVVTRGIRRLIHRPDCRFLAHPPSRRSAGPLGRCWGIGDRKDGNVPPEPSGQPGGV